MREYKFRVWDKENKEMLYQGSNTTHNNSVMDCRIVLDELGFDVLVRLYGKDEYEYRNNCELMQYTGLKDKNGTEIYEGDVCWEWIEFCKQTKPYVVEDLRKLYLETKRDDSYYRITSLQVIGNIYENPELLGGAG